MLRDIRSSAIAMGLLASIVGFASTFGLILAGLRGVGANDAQAALGLSSTLLATGIAGVILPLWTRLPMTVAWSAPGAALLASTAVPAGGFPEAVGAFIVSGVLLTFAAFVRPLARLVAAIPLPIASAMLAGILLPLALAPVRAVAEDWKLGLPIALAWLIGGHIHRLLAVPLALAAFIVVTMLGTELPPGTASALIDSLGLKLAFVAPTFGWESTIGIALPLFIVTMASQNIPGLSILRVNGFAPDAGRAFGVTGGITLLTAPFGTHAINLAAITAAMCAGPEAGDDPAKRYWAAVFSGLGYLLFGFIAGAAALFVSIAPSILIEAVAGLALIGAFAGAIVTAFSSEQEREAAAVTFLVAGGGLTIAGISGAFWGLLAGLCVHTVRRTRLTRRLNEATAALDSKERDDP